MENQPIIFGRDVNTNAITQIKTLGNVLFTNSGTLNDLSDVVITSATNNQVLKYSSPNWINGSLTLDNLSDVIITTPDLTNYLRYDGTNWRNVRREYITINMYGTTQGTLHANTTPKPIMAGISTYWAGTLPNPASNILGNMTSSITPFSSVFDTSTGFITLNTNKQYLITANINQGGVNLNSSTQTEIAIYNASTGTAVPFSPSILSISRLDIDFGGLSLSACGVVGTGVTKIAVMFRYLIAQGTAVNPLDTSITVSVLEL